MRTLLASFLVLLCASLQAQISPRFYNSIADMVAGNPNVNPVAIIKYADTPDTADSGGIFYYSPASVAATNTTTIFKPTSFAGRWIRGNAAEAGAGSIVGDNFDTTNSASTIQLVSGKTAPHWINVRDSEYGATGNGSTNDAAAIQAALNVAQSNGVSVYFPEGQYYINSPNGLVVTNNRVAIIGANTRDGGGAASGFTTKLLFGPAVTNYGLSLKVNGSSLKGIVLDGVNSNTIGGLLIQAGYCSMENVTVEKFGGKAGITIGGAGSLGNYNSGIFLFCSSFFNATNGWYIDSHQTNVNVNAYSFIGCHAYNNGGWGMESINAQLNTWIGFHSEDNGLGDMWFSAGGNNEVFGGDLESVGTTNLLFGPDTYNNVAFLTWPGSVGVDQGVTNNNVIHQGGTSRYSGQHTVEASQLNAPAVYAQSARLTNTLDVGTRAIINGNLGSGSTNDALTVRQNNTNAGVTAIFAENTAANTNGNSYAGYFYKTNASGAGVGVAGYFDASGTNGIGVLVGGGGIKVNSGDITVVAPGSIQVLGGNAVVAGQITAGSESRTITLASGRVDISHLNTNGASPGSAIVLSNGAPIWVGGTPTATQFLAGNSVFKSVNWSNLLDIPAGFADGSDDGPAGTGITTLNTLTNGTQTFSVGTAGTDFNIGSTGSVHTFNLPDASATARGVISTGTQTIAGAKTFSTSITVGTTNASGVADPYNATGWDGNLGFALKNDVRDKIESMGAGSGDMTKAGSNLVTGTILYQMLAAQTSTTNVYIDSNTNITTYTLTTNIALIFTNWANNTGVKQMRFRQDGTGTHTIAFEADVMFYNGSNHTTAPNIPTNAGTSFILQFSREDGTNWVSGPFGRQSPYTVDLAETGNVPTATTATNVVTVDGTDTTSSFAILDSATGVQQVKSDGGATYNAATGAASFTSLLEGATAVPNVGDNLSVFAATTGAQLLGVVSDETGTGTVVGSSDSTQTNVIVKTMLTVPQGTGPTTDAAGEIAFDTDAWTRGAFQIFDGTANTYAVAALATDAPNNGQVPKWNTGGTITWEDDNVGGGGEGSGVVHSGGTLTTDNALVRADGTTGTNVQSSPIIVSDSGALTAVDAITLTNELNAGSVVAGAITNNGLTASLPVFTDSTKKLVSNTMTGTGSVQMSSDATSTNQTLVTPKDTTFTNATVTGTAAITTETAGSVTITNGLALGSSALAVNNNATNYFLDLSPTNVSYPTILCTNAAGFALQFSTNRAVGRWVTVTINPNGTNRPVTINASWRKMNTFDTVLTNGKFGVVSLLCVEGTTETNILARWIQQP